jgi:hypothetical protein
MNIRQILLITILVFSAPINAEDNAKSFEKHANQAIKEFAETLKSALMLSMQTDGSVKSIAVCKDIAPRVAQQISTKYNLDISRTSLKVRNPANKADEWETAVLRDFETRLEAGETIKKLRFSEPVETEGFQQWRVMKAIGTDLVCVTCHGEKIPEQIQAELTKLYPNDQATGFKIGSVRGAFTVKQKLPAD